ncbi:MAG: hypothetical protein P8185_06990 [Deltaproteobacteria bacterium]
MNPNHERVRDFKSYRKISDIPGAVELAVAAIPISKVPSIIAECVDANEYEMKINLSERRIQ